MNQIFNKKDPTKNLNKLVQQLERTKIDIEFDLDRLEDDIKNAYRENRKPSPVLLQGWNTTQSLLTFTENQIAGFQNQLLLLNLGNSMKDALEVTKISKIEKELKKINLQINGIGQMMDQFNGMQMDSMSDMKAFSRQMEKNSQLMERMVGKLNKKAESQLGNEFLKKMMQEDPQFYKSLPPNLKNKNI